MARQRDEEALKVAHEIVDTVHGTDEERQFGVLVGMKAYRRGKNASDEQLAAARRDLAHTQEHVKRLLVGEGWSPTEVRYIGTIHHYGMKLAEIAELFHTSVDAVRDAVRMGRDSSFPVRKKQPPRLRIIDAG